jgi:O-methyltransferase involved in polyketide biosynthesis
MATTERISPTAYATGYLWYRLGLSHPALATPQGKRLDRPFGLMMKILGGNVFQNLMLARHHGIDWLLSQAIEQGQIGQVVEIAAGLSGRGWRMTQKYGDRLRYVETDLPHMAALKRRLLGDAGLLSERHRVLDLNALADDGPQSLAAITASLDPAVGTAIITEGLMNYLDPATAQGVWQRIATHLGKFPRGLYLADVYLTSENRGLAAKAFGQILQVFVRGRMHIHFQSPAHGVQLMKNAGFGTAVIHETRDLPATRELSRQPGGERVRILEARVPG